jgi:GAF domain-containing protein
VTAASHAHTRTRARQAALLAQLHLLDTAVGDCDAALQAELAVVVREAVTVTGMARGTVNLFGADQQHQVATCGFTGSDSPLEESLCAQVTGWVPDVYAFTDLAAEPGFTGNPWVDGRRGRVRGYASAPLVVDGTTVGTLCVFDEEPHPLSLAQCDRLGELAGAVVALLGRRRAR